MRTARQALHLRIPLIAEDFEVLFFRRTGSRAAGKRVCLPGDEQATHSDHDAGQA